MTFEEWKTKQAVRLSWKGGNVYARVNGKIVRVRVVRRPGIRGFLSRLWWRIRVEEGWTK